MSGLYTNESAQAFEDRMREESALSRIVQELGTQEAEKVATSNDFDLLRIAARLQSDLKYAQGLLETSIAMWSADTVPSALINEYVTLVREFLDRA